MSWRTLLQPGSFRGVPFEVIEDQERESGRRTVLHELPGRDDPIAQDLGRAARRWQFTALVLGADYLSRRDRLIEAFEREGPGELVLPLYGSLRVAVDGPVRISESTAAGGSARFIVTVVAVEDEALRLELIPGRAGPRVAASANLLRDAARTAAAEKFSIANRPGWVVDQAIARLQMSTMQLRALRARVLSRMVDATRTLVLLDDFLAEIHTLTQTPAELFRRLDTLVSRVVGAAPAVERVVERATPRLVSRPSSLAVVSEAGVPLSHDEVDRVTPHLATERSTSKSAWEAATELFLQPFGPSHADVAAPVLAGPPPPMSWGPMPSTPPEPGTLDSRESATGQVAINERAIARLVQLSALAAQADVLRQANWKLVGDATRSHDDLEKLLNAALDDASTDSDAATAERNALVELRTALARQLASLPGATSLHTGTSTRPALVLVYEAFGDAAKAASVAKQAGWAHPGFIPPGQTVEVWS